MCVCDHSIELSVRILSFDLDCVSPFDIYFSQGRGYLFDAISYNEEKGYLFDPFFSFSVSMYFVRVCQILPPPISIPFLSTYYSLFIFAGEGFHTPTIRTTNKRPKHEAHSFILSHVFFPSFFFLYNFSTFSSCLLPF